jgi:hypothetical protein
MRSLEKHLILETKIKDMSEIKPPLTIEYDVPFEVTQEQYIEIKKQLSGYALFREADGKYFCKLWFMKFEKHLRAILSNN